MQTLSTEDQDRALARWHRLPWTYLHEFFGVTLWSKQREICLSVRDNKRTVVKSGHNVGKTFITAAIVLWFLLLFRGSKVITTSATAHHLKTHLWSGIRKLLRMAKGPTGCTPLTTSIEIEPEWYAIGLSPKDADAFQGSHARKILVAIDEAQGVRPDIWRAAETMMTSADARLLAVGNPVPRPGPFREAFESPHRWNGITMSCLEHPNVVQKKLIYPDAITYEAVEEMREEYGEDSAMWQYRVLGEFPEESDESLVTLGMLENALELDCEIEEQHIGLDVARLGGDESLAMLVRNRQVEAIQSWQRRKTMYTVGRLRDCGEKWGVDPRNWHIDVLNMGTGVVDRCHELGLPVDDVNFSEKAKGDWRHLTRSQKFANRRAELFWVVRMLLDRRQLSISKEHGKLWHELTSIGYEHLSDGRILIQSKDVKRHADGTKTPGIRQKIGRSPDHADALAIAMSRSGTGNPRISWF